LPKRKFTVTALATISIATKVEAFTPEGALEIAEDRPMQTFCNQCSGGNPSEEWTTSGEIDGTAQDLKVVNVE
jgi:hypothetical protein